MHVWHRVVKSVETHTHGRVFYVLFDFCLLLNFMFMFSWFLLPPCPSLKVCHIIKTQYHPGPVCVNGVCPVDVYISQETIKLL